MHDSSMSKADLHVHSRHSDRPSEWFSRRIGSPESFTAPLEIYEKAQQRGMDFVTISDHNCIRGALEIAAPEEHLPFQRDHHLLSRGRLQDPRPGGRRRRAQFRMIQELRADIYDLHRYLTEENIFASVTHPFYRVNGRLTIDHLEKLLLMFRCFEEINGTRDRRAAGTDRRHFSQSDAGYYGEDGRPPRHRSHRVASRGRSASLAAATTTAASTSARPIRSRPTPRTCPSFSRISATGNIRPAAIAAAAL